MPIHRVIPYGFTSKPISLPQNGIAKLNGDSVNIDTHHGHHWPSKGFKSYRKVNPVTNKACSRHVHRDTDGSEYIWYVVDGDFYPEDGTDSPTAFLTTGVTAGWNRTVVNLSSPAGISVYLNGTNSEAQGVRVESGNLNNFLFDELAKPASVTLGTNATGGALSDDTYYVKQTWVDTTGPLTVEGEPSDTDSITLSGGGSAQTLVIPEPASQPARATGRRIYIGTTDSITTVFLEADDVDGSYEHTGALDGTVIPESRNGLLRTAVMPLANVDIACEHLGRLFIASTKSNEVYWSDRDAPNQWYATNGLNAEADGGWNGMVRGLASLNAGLLVFTTAGVFLVAGDFVRDTTGTNPSFAAGIAPPARISSFVCVSHNSIAVYRGSALFMSDQGPAFVGTGGSDLLAPDDMFRYTECLDFDYATRWVGAIDPVGKYYCLLVTRQTNSTRPQDGAGTAGIPDRVLRWDLVHGRWAMPLDYADLAWIDGGPNGAKGSTNEEQFFMLMSVMGYALQGHYGRSGGGPDDITAAPYDTGYLATANTASSATVTQSGVTDGDLVGKTATLYYPTDDSNYPGVVVTVTISGNTTSGNDLTINFERTLTVPSSTRWTVRIGGLVILEDLRTQLPVSDPKNRVRVKRVRQRLQHVVGSEAVG